MSTEPTSTPIVVSVMVYAPLATAWDSFTKEDQITKWNFASDDWFCPSAQNDLEVGGRFNYQMAAKDGSFQFDFLGEYTEVVPQQRIAYRLDDDRTVKIDFLALTPSQTQVTEVFDPESVNPPEMQMAGWQAILNNYKKQAESQVGN